MAQQQQTQAADKVRPNTKGKKSTKSAKDDEDDGEDEEPEVVKTPYSESPEASSAGDVNADKKLIRLPTAFDRKIHKSPKKADFHDEADFMEWKATIFERRAQIMVERAQEMRKSVEEMRKTPDPAKRAKILKIAKLNAAIKELERQIEEDDLTDASGDDDDS